MVHDEDRGPALSRGGRLALVLTVVFGALAIALYHRAKIPVPIDLEVYRAGGTLLLDSDPLYAAREGLPFTYAPFAALVFLPLALVPWDAAVVLLTTISILALVRSLWLLLDRLQPGHPPWLTLGGFTVLALLAEPVEATHSFGQVNVILLWLVVEDILGPRTSRIGGALTGVAAGIKLTPGIFLLMYLVVGAHRRFLIASISFALTVLVMIPLVGDQVVDFWTRVTWEVSRIGSPAFASNQSINGLVWRAFGPDPSGLLWLVPALAVVAVAMLAARRQWATSRLAAIAITSLAMLLASPISWTHHWVWALPACVMLWDRRRSPAAAALLGVGAVMFLNEVPMNQPRGSDSEYAWGLWEMIAGNSYVLWGVVALAYLGHGALRLRASEPEVIQQDSPDRPHADGTTNG